MLCVSSKKHTGDFVEGRFFTGTFFLELIVWFLVTFVIACVIDIEVFDTLY